MSKTEEMLERIACELHELNATINCRFDALDSLVEEVSNVASMISTTDDTLDEVRSSIAGLDVTLENRH